MVKKEIQTYFSLWPSIICLTVSHLPSGKGSFYKDILMCLWKATLATTFVVKIIKSRLKRVHWLIHHQFKVDHSGFLQLTVADVPGVSFALNHDENTWVGPDESGHHQWGAVSLLVTEWEIFEVESSLWVVLNGSDVVLVSRVLYNTSQIFSRYKIWRLIKTCNCYMGEMNQ